MLLGKARHQLPDGDGCGDVSGMSAGGRYLTWSWTVGNNPVVAFHSVKGYRCLGKMVRLGNGEVEVGTDRFEDQEMGCSTREVKMTAAKMVIDDAGAQRVSLKVFLWSTLRQ